MTHNCKSFLLCAILVTCYNARLDPVDFEELADVRLNFNDCSEDCLS